MSRRPRSLAGRLLLVVVVLSAGALALSSVLIAVALRPFLVDRIDEQLVAARVAAGIRLFDDAIPVDLGGGALSDPVPAEVLLPAGSAAGIVEADGSVSGVIVVGDTARQPTWPDDLATRAVDEPFDVDASGGGVGYRMVVAERTPGGERYVVAVSLEEVSRTIGRLGAVELGVSILVMMLTAAIGWWLVRIGLAPLRRIEQSADAIAAGDLSQRVPESDPRSEVGRLSAALNRMLGDIEAAFAARVASEDRLRRFVADASHELRTPLVSIRGYAELFFRGARDRPEDLETSMLRIQQESERMATLVDELLLLARFDEARDIDLGPVDLVRVAADGVSDLRAVEPDRPVDLDGPDSMSIVGDDVRLRQVVANLLANVRQHTPPGTPAHVSVGLEGDEAVLVVADEGPGMSAQDAEQVFERFFRSDRVRQRTRGGNGLGLAIVATLVDAHGGRVSVRTSPGQGAAFEVRLPVGGPTLPAS